MILNTVFMTCKGTGRVHRLLENYVIKKGGIRLKKLVLFLLIAVCAVSLFSSCGKKGSADEGYVKVSDGLGNGGAFSVRERKCVFGGGDLVVLYVRNNTEDEYSVTVTGSFFDAEGKEAAGDMAKTRTVFSGLEMCYLFRPSAKFDRFEYKLSSERRTSRAVRSSIQIPSRRQSDRAPSM